MRIVHLLNHTRRANGHVEMAVDLACEQAALGHEVTIVAGPGHFAETLAREGVGFVELRPREGRLGQLAMAGEVASACRRLRPDIVNAHMVASAVVARLARLVGSFALVTTVHNSFDRQARLMQVGDLVITVSDAVRREMAGKGVPERKLRTVRNGTIGGRRRPERPTEEMVLQRPAVATVAGLHRRKGIDTLIEAFAIASKAAPGAHLYLVGDGPDRAMLEARAAALECGANIHFLGYRQDPRAVLASTDIFVLASLAEPCGLALIEARQMGCACIATDVGGSPEVLGFGEKGRLVPPSRPADLAAALGSLLGDAGALEEMKHRSASDLAEWTVRRMTLETLAVYEEARRRSEPRPHEMALEPETGR